MRPAFKIKLTARDLEALAAGYEDYIPSCSKTQDIYGLLELEHMKQIFETIDTMIKKSCKTYTLSMQPPEAIAFYIVWQRVDIVDMPDTAKVVGDVIAKIDQVLKSKQLTKKMIA